MGSNSGSALVCWVSSGKLLSLSGSYFSSSSGKSDLPSSLGAMTVFINPPVSCFKVRTVPLPAPSPPPPHGASPGLAGGEEELALAPSQEHACCPLARQTVMGAAGSHSSSQAAPEAFPRAPV